MLQQFTFISSKGRFTPYVCICIGISAACKMLGMDHRHRIHMFRPLAREVEVCFSPMSMVWTLHLVATDSILENANADLTCERSLIEMFKM